MIILVSDIIKRLRPSYTFSVFGNTYEGINWNGNEPIPREEFMEMHNNYEQILVQEKEEKEARKQLALQRLYDLGLTPDDIRLVLEE